MKLIDILSEIGDASAKPFPWTPDGDVEATIKSKMGSGNNSYEFTYTINSPKTTYQVFIGSYLGERKSSGDVWYEMYSSIWFDVKDAEKEEQTTNLFEQYSLIATVIECVIDFIKKVNKLDNVKFVYIAMQAKGDNLENRPDLNSKRGKLYTKYIEKNLNRLPGNWEITIDRGRNEIVLTSVEEQ
jgi:hypothetical protein